MPSPAPDGIGDLTNVVSPPPKSIYNSSDINSPAPADASLAAALRTAAGLVQNQPFTQVTPPKNLEINTNNGHLDLLTILQREGHLTVEQVGELRMQQLNTGKEIEELLIEQKLVTSIDLAKAKAELYEVPFIHPNELIVSPEAIALVPKSVAQKFAILPFNLDKDHNELSVAMADPTDLQVIGFLEQKTGAKLKPYSAPKEELLNLVEERYGTSLTKEVRQVIKESHLGELPKGLTVGLVGGNVIQEAPIAKIVSYVLDYAVRTRASDIHIEPEDERTRVRYRVDGILYEKLVLPRQVHDALISRIKILGKMKIDEHRIPQDGRFNFSTETEEVDLRLSSLPTVHGEKMVMRLLKKTGGAKSLPELGLRGRALKYLEEAILRPHGIILVCGPTGSGKTTTLYSVITKVNSTKVNILTLEDPVEYQIPGVNQVQINPQAGLTFASGLRSFLRQDPNIIMVGEIRDTETADLAIQAALTGHLVFSTLHTNNSAGSLPRLLDMGAEPFLLSSTINAVVAQRVVRQICNSCRINYPPTEEILTELEQVLGKLFVAPVGGVSLQKGKGCEECNNTGYLGRVGIFEVLPMSEAVSRLIMERSPASTIEKQAVTDGMISMRQDGYLKVIEGMTTMEEVLRVAQN